MSERILLVDGHGLAYRAYYALPELSAPDGTPTRVLVGFINSLIKVVEDWKPHKVAVIFDAPVPTFRHERYEAYKSTRKPMPEDMRPQIPLLREMLCMLGICVISREGVEADDVLGSTALYWAEKKQEILMLTADKDMLQVLQEGVRIIRPKKGVSSFVLFDEEHFKKEYPFEPVAMIDYLALVGDSSDNVPGVPGIGDKGARELLKEYGTLEEIYLHLEDLKPGVRKKLEAGKESALLSKELVTLDLDYPVKESLFESCFAEREGLRELCLRLGMEQTYTKMVASFDVPVAEGPPEEAPPREEREVPLEELLPEPLLALSWKEEEGERVFLVGNEEGAAAALEVSSFFPPVLQEWTRKGGVLITSRYKQLCKDFPETAPLPESVWDLETGYYLLHPDRAQGDYPKLFEDPSHPGQGELWKQYRALEPEIKGKELLRVMRSVDLPLCPVLAQMERRGVRLHRESMISLEKDLDRRLEEIQQAVEEAGGMELNLNSPKQVGHLLFDVLGLPPLKKTKTGYSTNTSVLEVLASYPNGEVPQMLLEYRELSKIKSGFVQPFLQLADPKTRIIHTTFEHISTGTGRLSSTHPNLQNLPLYGDWARRFRSALGPVDEGACYVSADYSQIELRILAHLSREESLVEAFREGRDVHSETGARIFGVNPEEVTPEMRRQAKMVNFGLLYGMGGYGLADRLNIGRGEAQKLVDAYFAAFPGIQAYLQNAAEEAKKQGYTATLFGRRRPLSEVTTVEGRGAGALKRVAINTPLQGTAADIARMALVHWHKKTVREGLEMPLVLQIHDSLVIEVSRDEASRGAELLRTVMEGVVSLSVPLKVESTVGNNLAEI
ncbi:MAG TPA: DNA polymerase [Synergistaceae bacterium]|nr:DNA polymerase [Synergistaceae bacterium]HPQ36069.1 DNA polymerase [Synergistaceae bacterium]